MSEPNRDAAGAAGAAGPGRVALGRMGALLTSVLDSSDKVAEYIAECKEWHISLLPPDINESEADFTV